LTNWDKKSKHINEDFEKSMMMRYLIHVIGDIHQPLHAVTLYDDGKFFKGDMGGNLYLINYTSPYDIDNLHKLWDSGIGKLGEKIIRVL
jgi:hypothetical protein